jgi:hypothetical protein
MNPNDLDLSELVATAHSLVRVARLALENETSGSGLHDRGIPDVMLLTEWLLDEADRKTRAKA